MAARIENNETAWKGETPWHGLGFNVPMNATSDEMIEKANLGWQVVRRTLAMRDMSYTPPEGKGMRMLQEPLKHFKAIVREDNNTVFQIASDRYQVVQNTDIIKFFDEFINAGNAILEVVGAIDGGAKIWALARLKVAEANLGGGDILKPYLLITTSHDGTGATIAKPTQIRVVCNNTLQMALREDRKAEVRVRHNQAWTQALADAAKAQLGIAVEKIAEMNSLALQFSKVKVDGKNRIEFLRRLLNVKPEPVVAPEPTEADIDAVLASLSGTTEVTDKEIEALGRRGADILEATLTSPGSNLVTAKGTLWGVLNGVTYYVDHVRGRTVDSRLSNAWFGSGATLKQDAVEIAQEMAGITA
jgi:phage/plasmid-like protein (TIGR03299 family)